MSRLRRRGWMLSMLLGTASGATTAILRWLIGGTLLLVALIAILLLLLLLLFLLVIVIIIIIVIIPVQINLSTNRAVAPPLRKARRRHG